MSTRGRAVTAEIDVRSWRRPRTWPEAATWGVSAVTRFARCWSQRRPARAPHLAEGTGARAGGSQAVRSPGVWLSACCGAPGTVRGSSHTGPLFSPSPCQCHLPVSLTCRPPDIENLTQNNGEEQGSTVPLSLDKHVSWKTDIYSLPQIPGFGLRGKQLHGLRWTEVSSTLLRTGLPIHLRGFLEVGRQITYIIRKPS